MAGMFDDLLAYLMGGTQLGNMLGVGSPTASTQAPLAVAPGTSPTGPVLGGAPPTGGGGGLLGGLLGGQQPANPFQTQGLLGDSPLGNAIKGAFGGLGTQGGGFSGLGNAFTGAMDANQQRQQQQMRNYFLQSQVAQTVQDQKLRQQKLAYIDQMPTPAGVDPAQWDALKKASPDDAIALATKVATPVLPTHSGIWNEYQDAVRAGYSKDFITYQNEDANRRRPVSTTTNVTNVPKAPPTLEERNRDLLIHGDPSSPEYAAAWDDYMRPRLVANPDGTATVVTPTPPVWAKRPTYGGAPAAGSTVVPADTSIEGSAIDPSKTDTSGNELAQPVPATAAGTTTTSPAATATAPAPGFTTTTVGTPREKAPTQDEAKNRQLSQRVVQQLPNILKNYDELAKTPNILSAKIGGPMGTATMSTGAQLAYNGLLDLAASYLYSVSGATANPGEVQNLAQTIMPQVNDAPETLAAKKARIQEMADSIQPRTGQSATGDRGGGAKLYFDSQGNQIPGP